MYFYVLVLLVQFFMPKINKFLLIIPAEITFIFFLLIILPTIFLKEKPGIFQTSYYHILSLDSKNNFSQEFIADKNNLQSVSVLLKNPGVINKSQIEIESQNQDKNIKIELQDKNKSVLKSFNILGVNIGDPSWINFNFPCFFSQKGDKFFINISTDSELSDRFFVYADSHNSINFKTTYVSNSFKESFKDNLEQQINNFKSRNVFQTGFYLFTIVLVNILILI